MDVVDDCVTWATKGRGSGTPTGAGLVLYGYVGTTGSYEGSYRSRGPWHRSERRIRSSLTIFIISR